MNVRVLAAIMLAAGAARAAPPDPAIPVLVEETAASGVEASFTGGWEQMVGGGVATFDCDGDRKPEMLIAGGTSAARFWRNVSATGGPLRFRAEDVGLALTGVSGVWPLDVDGDGQTDLALLRVGENLLMRGLGGCRFERANETWGFDGGDGWSTAFAATWERGEAWPTLAVGNYIDRTQDAFPWGSCTDNWLHRPRTGERRFAPPLPLTPSYCALSMLFTDWNRSGQPALRVSNDREYYKGGQEQLWRLDPGAAPQPYTPKDGWQRLRVWGMGIASYDLNFDGYPEYFLTSMADNKLQSLAAAPKDGPAVPRYADIAFARGVIAQRPYSGGDVHPSTAWHPQFEDVNNDGLVDLFIAKGNVSDMPDFARKDPNNLLLQRSDGSFVEAGDRAGVASLLTARGAAVVDFNLDGLLDLAVVNRNGPAQIWRNTGPAGNWIEVAPQQEGPNRDAVGGWIEIDTGDHVLRREITVGGGHGGGGAGWHHFGLGARDTARLRILWPDGSASGWADLAAGHFYDLPRGGAAVSFTP